MRLMLLCCAATAATRAAAFPRAEDALDEGGRRKAAALRAPRCRRAVAAPEQAARETAALGGIVTGEEPLLADIGRGAWAGCDLATLRSAEPDRLGAWLRDPACATPGGETMDEVAARAARWLARIEAADDSVLAITHAAVVRAILAVTLDIPMRATFAIDIAPLSRTSLSFSGRWRLQGLEG